MRTKTRFLVLLLVAILALSAGVSIATQAAGNPNSIGYEPQPEDIQLSKIEPALQTAFSTEDRANFFILFGEQPDLSAAYKMPWEERGEYVVKVLTEVAAANQASVQAYLSSNGIPFQTFLVDGSIYIKNGNADLAGMLTAFPTVSNLRLERSHPIPVTEKSLEGQQILALEWGVSKINANDVWNLGYNGQGIVVANIDTGVRYTHNALINQYRGNQGGGSYDHTYSWYDPTGTYPSAPGDNHGHGTHTMGTIAGDDGSSNQIGVAPGAEWIACKGCTDTSCPDSALNACADWMLAPGGDSNMRPQVVNNSWGGCTYDNWYRTKVDAWRAAGIHPVFSAGNTSNCGYSAPFCGSIGTPGTYKEATSVGSTTSTDGLSSFSLWGPSEDPTASSEIKPEVSAPGSSIRSASSSSNTGYTTMSGTSMAAPHVSGALAVIWSACPALIGDFDASEQLLMDSALKIAYNTGCGNEGSGNIPNNAYGYGRIDVLEAYNECFSSGPTPTPSNTVPPTDTPEPTNTPTPTDNELDNGVPVTNLSGSTGVEDHYYMAVPAGASDLVFQISGGSGDADLYVRYGSPPTTSNYDCRPYLSGNSETCTFASPSTGTYYVMIRAYSSYSGVNLTGSFDIVGPTNTPLPTNTFTPIPTNTNTPVPSFTPTPSDNELDNGVPVANLSGSTGEEDHYYMTVPAGASNLIFEISGGSGDADLYVRFGSPPTTSTYDCRPYISGNNEACPFASPSTGTYYVMVRAYSSYSGVTLEGSYDIAGPTATPAPVIFSDNFETNQGWTVNPGGSDTATTGQWERANPEETTYSGNIYQQGTTVSGSYDLVTEGSAGSSIGTYDIDGGVTSVRSPNINLPSGSGITLSFSYYLAHYSNGGSDDFLRVTIVGSSSTVVFEELGAANIDAAAWESFSTSLDAFAGQTIYILIEAADGGSGSLIEAGVDDVVISQ